MKITFALRARKNDDEAYRLEEEDLQKTGKNLTEFLEDSSTDKYGYVTFHHSGSADVVIEDDIYDLIEGLCFETATKTIQSSTSQVRFYKYFGGLEMRTEADMIRLTKDSYAQLLGVYPKVEFCRALLDCADRFLAFLRRHYENDSIFQENHKDLLPQLQEAKDAFENLVRR